MENDPDTNPESSEQTGTGHAELSFEESRVLGCLLEKEATTPDYYPLTRNALATACNQKSNRDPLVSFDTKTVTDAIESLRYKGYASTIHEAGARGPKSKHVMERIFPYLQQRHFALLAVLMLRGQQTLGELKQRTERMHPFSDLDSVQSALDDLVQYDPKPLAKMFQAGGGRRVMTFAHLLCGDDEEAASPGTDSAGSSASSPPADPQLESRVGILEKKVVELGEELENLRKRLGD